jgi:hypothetical protein
MPSAGGLAPSDLERPWKVHFQASTPADWGSLQVCLPPPLWREKAETVTTSNNAHLPQARRASVTISLLRAHAKPANAVSISGSDSTLPRRCTHVLHGKTVERGVHRGDPEGGLNSCRCCCHSFVVVGVD